MDIYTCAPVTWIACRIGPVLANDAVKIRLFHSTSVPFNLVALTNSNFGPCITEPGVSVLNSFTQDVLTPLVRGIDLERAAARQALENILLGQVDPLLIASFLTAMTAKGETADEMTGFIEAMIANATTFTVAENAIDIVGTGGDQLHTVNVSTMAALVVAGCGIPVAKHGNRSASSSVGSADVLEALGVRIDVPQEMVLACIQGAGIGFMSAPIFHHAFSHLAPVRRSLGFRTIFNVLGPLANPAMVRRSLIGVADVRILDHMATVIANRGVDHVILLTSDDGLDELSLGSEASLRIVKGTTVESTRMDAGGELHRSHAVDTIRGGDLTHNVEVVRNFLAGTQGPIFDVVCANAALGLVAGGHCTDLQAGFSEASTNVLNGNAAQALEKLVALSNS